MSASGFPGVELQCAADVSPPAGARADQWVAATLARAPQGRVGEVVIRLVGAAEGRELNRRYRGRDGATNVLAFPAEPPPGLPPGETSLVGDLVICMPLLHDEAVAQSKTELEHFAHLVVHGTLHLVGLDHGNNAEAAEMETLEREIMQEIGFADPYLAEHG